MKSFFFILVMVMMVASVNAVQPARKPFIKIKIDGVLLKTGDIPTITHGQKLKMEVGMEGGRRDFCKFPDAYANIAGTAQILTRGDNGLIYQLDGKKSEWKLIRENVQFTTDDFFKVVASSDQHSAELVVTNDKFPQSSVKVTIKAIWQFSDETTTNQEENLAETTVFFKIAGASDDWFFSKNIKAKGIKNEAVQEKLDLVQADCDTIVKKFHQLNFSGVQQSIRNIQASVSTLKATIDEVKRTNPSYQTIITFVGLPSDDPYNDIEAFNSVKNNWATLSALIKDLSAGVSKLPVQENSESKKNLLGLLERYNDWYAKLPEVVLINLTDYIPAIKPDSIKLTPNIASLIPSKNVPDYTQTLNRFKVFLAKRSEQAATETQQINSVQSRLQAVRLFDGMLRSYFSSIVWAEWQSTRGF
jgi:hypothetical protein